MTPDQIDRVFGRGRLKMVTGEHVEVYREAVAPGERRRYTKRFLNTREGDFGQWTEREWRILARLIGHGITCVPEVVQFDRGRIGGMRIVQTYDAGVTVDQWATLLPVIRGDRVYRHVFEDCAHWWALAHHCLLALQEIHRLELVHLDIKGDNVCIPYAPVSFDPQSADPSLRPVFPQFALIDFAFALVSKESLTTPLPIGWQREYDYQSPRLLSALEKGRDGDLQATRELDWRCDMYSLAAMLKRYLPDGAQEQRGEGGAGWTPARYDSAKALILRVREAHDTDSPMRRPHAELIETTSAALSEADLARSLERGWGLARETTVPAVSPSPLTPVTRLAPVTRIASPIHVTRSGRTAVTVVPHGAVSTPDPAAGTPAANAAAVVRARSHRGRAAVAAATLAALAFGAGVLWVERAGPRPQLDEWLASVRGVADHAGDSAGSWLRREDAPRAAAETSARTKAVDASAPGATAGGGGPGGAADGARRDMPRSSVATPHAAPSLAPVPPSAAATGNTAAHPAPLAEARTAGNEARAPASASAPYRAPVAVSRNAQPSSRPGGHAPASDMPHMAQSAAAAPAPRTYAPWASLQPPAWITSRSRSPGNPPGYKEPEARAATEPKAAPIDTPQETPAVQAAPLAADPPRAPANVTAPLPGTAVNEARATAPRVATNQSLFASKSAAPVEDRSVAMARAPAAASEQRSAVPVETPRDEPATQAQRLVAETVPGVARQGEIEVSRVLVIAASAYKPAQDRALADAARMARIRDDAALQPLRATATAESRRLHERARQLVATGRSRDALDLELRAFAANPRDPEIAGQLAVLYLKATPPRPDLARDLALTALTARSTQYATTRLEDWQTFAAASALSGREADARNALFVTLALSANVERTCVAAWNAITSYGSRMRSSVDALLYRVYMRGHSVDSPWCAYPPDWSSPPRLAGELALGH
jgi:hypothetical protein